MDSRSHASPEPESAPEGRHSQSQSREKLEETLALGQQGLAFLGQLGDLFRLEAMLAIQSLPKLVMFWLMILPVTVITWIDFAVMVSWAVYAWLLWPLAGFATFFALNLLLLGLFHWGMRRYKKRMSFKETRTQLRTTLGGLRDEISKASQTKESANDP